MKIAAYTNCQPTDLIWLPQIPVTWQQIRGRFVMGVNPSPVRLRDLDESDEVSFVPMEAIGERGGLSLDRSRPIDEIGSGYTEFEDGDVVVAKITPCFENGKVALAEGLRNGVAFGTTELHVLRAGKRLDKHFLFYLTTSHTFLSLGESEMYGAGGQKRVPPEFAKDFRVPLPPLEEQQTIARFLDAQTARIDTLVAKKRQLIAKLKEKRSALIARTVTRGLPPEAAKAAGLEPNPEMKDSGVEWLGKIPAHWNAKRLKYLFQCFGGGTPSKANAAFWDGDIPWVSPKDMSGKVILDTEDHITEDAVIESATRMVAPGATLLVVRSGILKHTIPVATNAISVALNQDMKALVSIGAVCNTYLAYFIEGHNKSLLDSWSKSSCTVESIESNYMLSSLLPVPPAEEQQAIAAYLDHETSRIDQLVAKVEVAIDRLTEYRQALITPAVTGKIDVREAA
jgi:type I restriction enzyme S subunit